MSEHSIVAVEPERLDDLKPIWRTLYEHHLALTPHLRERSRSIEEAWRARREAEREWIANEPLTFVLAVESEDGYLGYAFVRVRAATFATSWSASDPLAELSILAVLPQARGRGVGSALLDAVEERLEELGVEDMAISVVTTNVDAMRLYERRGAVQFVTELVQRITGPTRVSR
ncbi:MAG TPA: GNAT family N-acetyltransferase [Solirubrobacteraceae bacterium]|jgi:GNAT superfamily N-acetyltransferase|nr:GNAT family N-acetyltransferase [Solirubrobacteraceae bacterium]